MPALPESENPVKTIYRYPVQITDQQTIALPAGAEVLSVQHRQDTTHQVDLWALCDPEAALQDRRFVMIGTGHAVPEQPLNFLATVQVLGGAQVYHVFEVLGR